MYPDGFLPFLELACCNFNVYNAALLVVAALLPDALSTRTTLIADKNEVPSIIAASYCSMLMLTECTDGL